MIGNQLSGYLLPFYRYRNLLTRSHALQKGLDVDFYARAWVENGVVLKHGRMQNPERPDQKISRIGALRRFTARQDTLQGLGDRVKRGRSGLGSFQSFDCTGVLFGLIFLGRS